MDCVYSVGVPCKRRGSFVQFFDRVADGRRVGTRMELTVARLRDPRAKQLFLPAVYHVFQG